MLGSDHGLARLAGAQHRALDQSDQLAHVARPGLAHQLVERVRRAKDLDAVVDFYNDRFAIGFTAQDKSDLVAFLHSL